MSESRPVHAGGDVVGRQAGRPGEIPARGWLAILRRVRAEVKQDNVPLLSAGVAFYAMLAVFPAIIAVITIYALVADPAQVESQVGEFARSLPSGADALLTEQLKAAAGSADRSLSIGLAASLIGVLWSVSSGVQALVKGLNIVYDEQETRGFLKLRALSLLLTIGALVVAVLALGLVAVFPAVVNGLDLGRAGELAASAVRWVVLALLILVALAVAYRFAPDRANPRWRWVSPGALVALVVWLLASVGFSVYVDNFGKYNETYGALAAVIILLLWLFLSAFSTLLGAELDAEMERQTARDTTTGPPRPMGERDAEVADTLGDGPPRR